MHLIPKEPLCSLCFATLFPSNFFHLVFFFFTFISENNIHWSRAVGVKNQPAIIFGKRTYTNTYKLHNLHGTAYKIAEIIYDFDRISECRAQAYLNFWPSYYLVCRSYSLILSQNLPAFQCSNEFNVNALHTEVNNCTLLCQKLCGEVFFFVCNYSSFFLQSGVVVHLMDPSFLSCLLACSFG